VGQARAVRHTPGGRFAALRGGNRPPEKRAEGPAAGVPAALFVRDNPGARALRAAQNAARSARDGIRRVAPRFAKYLVGYMKIRVERVSTGPNDASTRQKLAFPS